MYYSIGGEVYFEGFFMKKNTIYKAALALLLLAGTNSTPVLADETTSQEPAVIATLEWPTQNPTHFNLWIFRQ